MFFKIKRKSPLKKLMDVYAQRQGGTPSAYRFIFDGNRIVETQTPDDVRARPARARRAAAAALLLPVHRSGPSQRPAAHRTRVPGCSSRWRTTTSSMRCWSRLEAAEALGGRFSICWRRAAADRGGMGGVVRCKDMCRAGLTTRRRCTRAAIARGIARGVDVGGACAYTVFL